MSIRRPSSEELQEILRRALSCLHAVRQFRDAEHRMRGFSPRDRSVQACEAIDEYQHAVGAWRAERDELRSYLDKSGGRAPVGWPPSVSDTLRKITSMLEWGPDFIFDGPDEIPALEAEIESLAAAGDSPIAGESWISAAEAHRQAVARGIKVSLQTIGRAAEDDKFRWRPGDTRCRREVEWNSFLPWLDEWWRGRQQIREGGRKT
jgi:hypothetical protein